jgi:hypothetical protein
MGKPIVDGSQSDGEVRVPRHFSAKYKLEILEEIDMATERGEVGKILRREGLYSSLITKWRQARAEGTLQASTGKKRGPKVDRVAAELKRLRVENERLKERLETQERLAEAQRNAFALLQSLSRESANTK